MPTRRPSPDTRAIISAIENATAAAKVVSDAVAKELVDHTRHDDERFDRLTALVERIGKDVESLLASRSFQRGAWKAVTIIAGVVATIISSIVTLVHARLGP